LREYDLSISSASKLLEMEKTPNEIKTESHLTKGKSYLALFRDSLGLKELNDVNSHWLKYDFVITNSKITVGINYDDIINLFGITNSITDTELKYAKNKMLKIHPDKSGLHPKFFRFYNEAYKMLYLIWEFKQKGNTKNSEYSYQEFDLHKNEIRHKNIYHKDLVIQLDL